MGETSVILDRKLVREPGNGKIQADRVEIETAFQRPGMNEERKGSWAVLLDNIRSGWNVGSILRSADGFGFRHAYLCGITPTPDHEAVTKTSLGAEDSVPWSYHKDAVRLLRGLLAEGWSAYALEDEAGAFEIRRADSVTGRSPLEVLIVGNEVTGVDPGLLELCEAIFYIPMQGLKKSFNVAIAFSLAAFSLNAPGSQ
jgi:tRNA G18 (ribose-2'-O)-methylase SpoU